MSARPPETYEARRNTPACTDKGPLGLRRRHGSGRDRLCDVSGRHDEVALPPNPDPTVWFASPTATIDGAHVNWRRDRPAGDGAPDAAVTAVTSTGDVANGLAANCQITVAL